MTICIVGTFKLGFNLVEKAVNSPEPFYIIGGFLLFKGLLIIVIRCCVFRVCKGLFRSFVKEFIKNMIKKLLIKMVDSALEN